MFQKEEETKNLTIEDFAKELNVKPEDLYDMTLDEISELSHKIAEHKIDRVGDLLDRRSNAVGQIRRAQQDAGITQGEMTRMFFQDLSQGAEK